jgi:hypothetical protein
VGLVLRQKSPFFLISNPERTQSFVFHTRDPQVIFQAREQIQNPAGRKILIAKIVEDNLDARIDSGGLICFWNYKIFRELSAQELQKSSRQN